MSDQKRSGSLPVAFNPANGVTGMIGHTGATGDTGRHKYNWVYKSERSIQISTKSGREKYKNTRKR